MAQSRGRSIALIILVVVVIMLFVKVTPFFFAPFGAFSGVWESVKHSVQDGLHIRNGFIPGLPFIPLFSVVFFILWIMVIVWVYRDAERRGLNGLLWALLVFVGNLIGLIIYLIIRTENTPRSEKSSSDSPPNVRSDTKRHPQKPPSAKTKDETAVTAEAIICTKCKREIDSGFAFCPHCGKHHKHLCPECHSQVEKGWKVCPHCGTKLED